MHPVLEMTSHYRDDFYSLSCAMGRCFSGIIFYESADLLADVFYIGSWKELGCHRLRFKHLTFANTNFHPQRLWQPQLNAEVIPGCMLTPKSDIILIKNTTTSLTFFQISDNIKYSLFTKTLRQLRPILSHTIYIICHKLFCIFSVCTLPAWQRLEMVLYSFPIFDTK